VKQAAVGGTQSKEIRFSIYKGRRRGQKFRPLCALLPVPQCEDLPVREKKRVPSSPVRAGPSISTYQVGVD